MASRSSIIANAIAIAFALALVPATSSAHDEAATTVDGHIEEDSVVHTPAMEARFEHHTEDATADDAARAAGKVNGTADQVGQWGPLVNWPVVAIHASLLDTGKVLAYDSVGDTNFSQDHTRATVWNPANGNQTSVDVNLGFNIFCSGLAHLTDGTVFIAGGNKNGAADGIAATHIFDSDDNSWTLGPTMKYERWYPSVTPLNNGEMLITEGRPPIPEVRQTDGSLRTLTTASQDLPLYPWLDVGPDGRAFYSGPDTTLRALDPSGTGSWQAFNERDPIYRDYGSHAMYDIGKILVTGGGSSTKDSRVIDLNGATPQVSTTSPMTFGRRQHNLTVLADGTVLATGGNSSGAPYIDMNKQVYDAELWNPGSGQWKTLAAMQGIRQYHSTALLLPDGRVLSAGGGVCGVCDDVGYLSKNAEVFSPPYLFKQDGSGALAPRPQVTGAPAQVSFDVPFQISTPDPSSIDKVALLRLGSVTHSVNMEQRFVPLTYTANDTAVQATGPSNANIAPPGPYMLFLIDSHGVPSVAKMVTVTGVSTGDTTPPETSIGSGPAGPTNNNKPTFTFSSNEVGSTFECRLGSGSFTSCSSPRTLGTLIDGDQTFSVRATDPAGNTDATPAIRGFKVDTAAPDTTIASGPSGPTNDSMPTFTFSSSEAGSSFECQVDNGAFGSCSGPGDTNTTESLSDGPHTFAVRAADPASNVDPSPASRSFTIDTTPPETTIDSGPSGTTTDNTPTFTFSSGEAGSTFECRVDASPFAACSGPGQSNETATLPDGPHTFEVRAIDLLSNADPTPAGQAFTIDTSLPPDTTPPDLTLTRKPRDTIRTGRKWIEVTTRFASEPDATFSCKLDEGGYEVCASPYRAEARSRPHGGKQHKISVRATDQAGNMSAPQLAEFLAIRRK